MPAKFEAHDSDPGFKKAKANAKAGADQVLVGILGGANSEIALYAGANEYGTAKIPQRSFLRSMLDERKKEIAKIQQALTPAILLGKSSKTFALKKIGVLAQGWTQLKIRTGPFTPNKPATIAAKGTSSPLIDTNTMRKAISHEVRGGTRASTRNR